MMRPHSHSPTPQQPHVPATCKHACIHTNRSLLEHNGTPLLCGALAINFWVNSIPCLLLARIHGPHPSPSSARVAMLVTWLFRLILFSTLVTEDLQELQVPETEASKPTVIALTLEPVVEWIFVFPFILAQVGNRAVHISYTSSTRMNFNCQHGSSVMRAFISPLNATESDLVRPRCTHATLIQRRSFKFEIAHA